MSRIEEIKSRLEKATPGPWHTIGQPFYSSDEAGMTVFNHWDPHKGTPIAECNLTYEWEEGEPDGRIQNRNDADFIAHAPEDIRYLISEIERLDDGSKGIGYEAHLEHENRQLKAENGVLRGLLETSLKSWRHMVNCGAWFDDKWRTHYEEFWTALRVETPSKPR